MSDKLVTSNGETVEIDFMIEALETAPDKGEILQALKGLRADKVKPALGETIKARHFDLYLVLSDFINDGEKSARTRETYQRQVERFLQWLERKAIHVLQVTRADVNRFKEYLSGKYSSNTVRLTLAPYSRSIPTWRARSTSHDHRLQILGIREKSTRRP
ncbi:MAG: site-specific integrase [Spirochaetales bacterium]|nr:site-specific integrase [Spirochaetales bacterium]